MYTLPAATHPERPIAIRRWHHRARRWSANPSPTDTALRLGISEAEVLVALDDHHVHKLSHLAPILLTAFEQPGQWFIHQGNRYGFKLIADRIENGQFHNQCLLMNSRCWQLSIKDAPHCLAFSNLSPEYGTGCIKIADTNGNIALRLIPREPLAHLPLSALNKLPQTDHSAWISSDPNRGTNCHPETHPWNNDSSTIMSWINERHGEILQVHRLGQIESTCRGICHALRMGPRSLSWNIGQICVGFDMDDIRIAKVSNSEIEFTQSRRHQWRLHTPNRLNNHKCF